MWLTASLTSGTLIPCSPILQAVLAGFVPTNILLSCTYIHSTGPHSHYKHWTNFLWHFKVVFFFLKTNHSWSTHTMYKGVQDIQLTVPQGANTEQDGHKELTNTEYLSVLQNSPETHLELNKGNYFYCMWLSQTPLAQECFLDHFNSK